jgi:hypothetical protein
MPCSLPGLLSAAREAGDADFDVLMACAFNYEAHATGYNEESFFVRHATSWAPRTPTRR